MTKKKTQSQFLDEAKEIHGERYDYSLVEYRSTSTNIKIICRTHGVFEQTPGSHLNGSGCNRCARKLVGSKIKLSPDEFKRRATEVHDGLFDYSKADYQGLARNVEVICKEHGSFFTKPFNHLRGAGCVRCAYEAKGLSRRAKLAGTFIEAARAVHGNLYDYSLVEYDHSKANVTIKCKEHGEFSQLANSHLNGHGCQKCGKKISVPEVEIADYIESLGIRVLRNRKRLFADSNFEADIVVPDKKIVIEYDGLIWHSERFNKILFNVLEKTRMANKAGYRCIHIREDMWLNKKEVVKALLSSALGIFQHRIGARQTEKREINLPQYKDFCGNHLHGYRSAKHKYGLFHKDELVACIGYAGNGELIRYVVKNYWQIQGALPKLLKGEKVTYSFCDLSFFNGSSYKKAGFEFEYNTRPNYIYVKGGNSVRSRQQMMKHKLPKLFDDFDSEKTEVENCNANGWYRLFDAGNAKYRMSL